MRKITILIPILVLAFILNTKAQTIFFGNRNIISSNADEAWSVYAIDIDGDGDVDVLSASANDNKIAWYENDGFGNFGSQQVITTNAQGAHSVYAIDIDGDGDVDVLSASASDDKVAWYENDGSGNFGSQQIITTNADYATSVYATDIDGDGDVDVLSASAGDDKLAWYENDGSGNFGVQQVISTSGDMIYSVYATDIDGDGDQDVLSASRADDKIAWYENDGSGNFGVQQIISTNADGANSVYATDIDGDGDQDVLSASWTDDKIAWYENNGSGNFGAQQIITTGANGAYSVYASDLDGDGDPDVLSASIYDDKIAWYENDGSGNFGAQQIIYQNGAVSPYSVYAADLDGDGDPDVLSASYSDDGIAWYENTCVKILSQPTSMGICEGNDFTISVDAIGDSLVYQWKKDGVDISGATSNTYQITNATYSDEGIYTCEINAICGIAVLSDGASLTILNNTGIDVQMACDSFTWIDGNTYTSDNNTATDTLTNIAGCDSIVTLNLTVNYSTTGDTTVIACDSFNWNGNLYTTSGDYMETLTTVTGCDSVVTLHLIVNNSQTSDTTVTACDSFTWYGNTYTASGDYTETFTAFNGCDSVVTLHLTINTVDNSVTQNGDTLISNQGGALYQWIDCSTNNGISGENQQVFVPAQSGDYAVQIIFNNCTDTSSCYTVSVTNIENYLLFNTVQIYPNPNAGQFNIDYDLGNENTATITLYDIMGRKLETIPVYSVQGTLSLDITDYKQGIYFVQIQTAKTATILKVILEK